MVHYGAAGIPIQKLDPEVEGTHDQVNFECYSARDGRDLPIGHRSQGNG